MSINPSDQLCTDETPQKHDDGHVSVQPRDTNGLMPDIGTSFFNQEMITVFDNYKLYWESPSGVHDLLGTWTWRVDVYKYVVGAKPDDVDFQQKGGRIYIIMVHGGTTETGGNGAGPPMAYMQTIEVPKSVSLVKHHPTTGTGIKDGSNWNYSILFEQRMPMFKNQANETYVFNAVYKEDFTRIKSQQTGREISSGFEFAVPFDVNTDPYFPFSINGLSVFSIQDPNAFPLTFAFKTSKGYYDFDNPSEWHEYNHATSEVKIDFEFKA